MEYLGVLSFLVCHTEGDIVVVIEGGETGLEFGWKLKSGRCHDLLPAGCHDPNTHAKD